MKSPEAHIIDLVSSDDDATSYVPSSSSSTLSAEPPTLLTGSSEDDDSDTPKRWPYDYYVQDIVTFIQAVMDNKPSSHCTNADLFLEHFPLEAKYKSSTYHDNKNRWFAAPEESRQKALAAGRPPGGLWSVFAKENPMLHAAKKAAMKRRSRKG